MSHLHPNLTVSYGVPPEKGITMQNLGYYNGKIGTLEELTVPFNDRVNYFGDGVYEATFTRNHKVFALEEHIDRFYRSAAMVDIKIPMEKAEMAVLLRELVAQVDSPEQQVYFQVTRGTQPRNHTYPEDMMGNFWVVLKPMPIKDIGMEVKAILREDIRFHQCHIKTLNLLPAVMYSQEAARAGVYEAILYRTSNQSGCGELCGGMPTSVAMPTCVAMASTTRSKQTTASITPPAKLSSRLTVRLESFCKIAPMRPPRPVPTTPAMAVVSSRVVITPIGSLLSLR